MNSITSSDFIYSARNAIDLPIQKVKDVLASPVFQIATGFVLGLGLHKIYQPLTEKIITVIGCGAKSFASDPFKSLDLGSKIIYTPYICLLGPILEEKFFRGDLQGFLKEAFHSQYQKMGLSYSAAKMAARVTAIFFSSIVFGLIHFVNALIFWCNPMLFLPQVVAAILMGFLFGAAKEISGDLALPIGMHIGNNTTAWASLCWV